MGILRLEIENLEDISEIILNNLSYKRVLDNEAIDNKATPLKTQNSANIEEFNIFDKLFEYILIVEGGYSDHPNDKGGKTKYGIIDTVAQKHNLDVKTLTKEDAKEIYKKDYYLKNKLDKIENNKIALSIFDWIVNSGNWAIKNLQVALNKYGKNLKVDGIIGTNTIKAVNNINNLDIFLKEYHNLQRAFYQKICINRPNQKVFLKGWLNRVSIKEKFIERELK